MRSKFACSASGISQAQSARRWTARIDTRGSYSRERVRVHVVVRRRESSRASKSFTHSLRMDILVVPLESPCFECQPSQRWDFSLNNEFADLACGVRIARATADSESRHPT